MINTEMDAFGGLWDLHKSILTAENPYGVTSDTEHSSRFGMDFYN